MGPQEKVAFVREHHRAVLVTHRRDGRLQTSPIVCGVDDADRVVISVTEDRAKTRNVRRDQRVSLCVMDDQFFGPWVQIDGRAEIVDLPEAMTGLKDLYRQVAGEHPDWDDYERAMVDDRRVLMRIVPDAED
jgi:PPOX class probable F420-dependent enzyme